MLGSGEGFGDLMVLAVLDLGPEDQLRGRDGSLPRPPMPPESVTDTSSLGRHGEPDFEGGPAALPCGKHEIPFRAVVRRGGEAFEESRGDLLRVIVGDQPGLEAGKKHPAVDRITRIAVEGENGVVFAPDLPPRRGKQRVAPRCVGAENTGLVPHDIIR